MLLSRHDFGARGRIRRRAPPSAWHDKPPTSTSQCSPLAAALVTCVCLAAVWLGSVWLLRNSLTYPTTPAMRHLLVAERMPEREERPLFQFQVNNPADVCVREREKS
jgi:hypothetical protein